MFIHKQGAGINFVYDKWHIKSISDHVEKCIKSGRDFHLKAPCFATDISLVTAGPARLTCYAMGISAGRSVATIANPFWIYS